MPDKLLKKGLLSHSDIERRAYELYLARGCTDGQDIQDWLFAEEQLHRERDERVGTKTTHFIVGPGGVAKTNSPDADYFVIEEQERRQVRASEELKEEREHSTLPPTKAVAVGQQKSK